MPASLRFEILSNVHDHVSGAHFGVHKTFDKIKQRYWWKGMYKDVEHWCKSCTECSMRKSPRNSKKAPLLPIPVEGAFDRVAVDVLGTFQRQIRAIGTLWCSVITSLVGVRHFQFRVLKQQ